MTDDAELLRRYGRDGDEAAFAEVVRRRVDLVYAAALRQTRGDDALARDAVQSVFIDLTRKAVRVAEHEVLVGWLHTATRFAVAKAIRAESRRRAREQEAGAMNAVFGEPAETVDWSRLQPVLDAVLGELKERERAAILLRFFEEKTFTEVGAALALTETAARSCVDRALEKMQARLARRGVTSTTAALAGVLANQVVTAAPAGLATAVAKTALTTGAAGGLGASAWLTIFMSNAKVTTAVGLVAVLSVGTVAYQRREIERHESALTAAAQDQATLRAQLRALAARLTAEQSRAQAADEDNGKLLSAVAQVQASPVKPPVRITRDLVDARYRRAQELAQRGETAAALAEYLWCFDEGMPRISSYSGVRRSFLLGEMAKLGERDPAALAALRARRDAAKQRVLTSTDDFDAAADYVAINQGLKESSSTLELFDQFPMGDPRRNQLRRPIREQLREARRYAESIAANSYAEMSANFELMQGRALESRKATPDGKAQEAEWDRIALSKLTVNDIELLAGAGDLEHARSLAERLLKFDGSAATKALLQQQLARAGQPDLLAGAK